MDNTTIRNDQPPLIEFVVNRMGSAYPNEYQVIEYSYGRWSQLVDCFLSQDDANAMAVKLTNEAS